MDRTLAGDERTMEMLWGQRTQPTRGPRPTLDLDRIAHAALDIADTEGLAAVSMQRVAGDLDVTKMALYRYVSSKTELLAAMIDLAVGPPPDLSHVEGGWRVRLEEWARQLSAAWRDHPWLPGATMGRRVMGPNEVGWVEAAVAALADTGLDGTEQMDSVLLMSGHIRNTQSAGSAGSFPWTADGRLSPTLADVFENQPERYPALTQAIAAASESGRREDPREYGLRRILDGLELVIAARSAV
ncbi:MAG: TetR/AcrR family transcriptional regulator [Nocardioidaceae bacterium]